MTRVVAYVDGFNLYFGLKSKSWKKYYWLDLNKLAATFLKPGQMLQDVYYFTSRIRDNGHNAADQKRQSDYLEALALHGVKCQFGHYLKKERTCRSCHSSWVGYEEKMTDVNLAIQFMADAFDDAFDLALIISGDSDLTTPIRRVRERFPNKRVIVVFPPKRHSKELELHAHGRLDVNERKLRASQLPDQLLKPDGFVLKRPATWA